MSIKSRLGLISMMAAMASMTPLDETTRGHVREEDIDMGKKTPPVPKGCVRYFFNKEGECLEANSLVYFDAMKKKTAYDKWNRWLKQS